MPTLRTAVNAHKTNSCRLGNECVLDTAAYYMVQLVTAASTFPDNKHFANEEVDDDVGRSCLFAAAAAAAAIYKDFIYRTVMLNLAPPYAAMSKSIAVDGCAARQQRPAHVGPWRRQLRRRCGLQSTIYKYRLPLG